MLEGASDARSGLGLSRRDLLRAATEGLHRRLDARFTPADFRERSTYVRFLECTARALLPLERALNHSVVPERFADWQLRRRSDALSRDLRALDAAHIADDGVCHRELQPAEAFGVLYVLEGSRLGSKILLSHTQSSEDPTLRSATRYLSANDAALWRTFLATLEDEKIMLHECELVRGASFAFECYLSAYSANG